MTKSSPGSRGGGRSRSFGGAGTALVSFGRRLVGRLLLGRLLLGRSELGREDDDRG